jgi:hypothetical protein
VADFSRARHLGVDHGTSRRASAAWIGVPLSVAVR